MFLACHGSSIGDRRTAASEEGRSQRVGGEVGCDEFPLSRTNVRFERIALNSVAHRAALACSYWVTVLAAGFRNEGPTMLATDERRRAVQMTIGRIGTRCVQSELLKPSVSTWSPRQENALLFLRFPPSDRLRTTGR
jgi:hypothetical protein